MSAPTRRLACAAAGALALTLLAGCSGSAQQASDRVSQDQADAYRAELQHQREIERAAAALPDRPAGVVSLDGSTRGSLSGREATLYESTANAARVELADNGEDQAFQELCAGQIDLVDSARPISRAEWEACQSVGLDVVQFEVAAEAVVVAIKSETDVGADCLRVDQVRDIYRAGSPVTNWSDAPLGFDDVPLKVGGPGPENNGFSFFGRYVLDAPEPSMVDLRSDYVTAADDEQARRFVVGSHRTEVEASRFDDVSRLRAQRNQALQDARDELLAARQEMTISRAERKKGIRDHRSAADQAKDVARVRAARVRLAAAKARVTHEKDRWTRMNATYDRIAGARKRYETYSGHVAYFRFSYYELFEDELRPFEITTSDGRRNCIFPSQRTITSGEYPLARQLLITTTTRSLARGEVRDFLGHYLNHAQDEAGDDRLVPLPDETVDLERAWVTGDQAPLLYAPDDDATAPATPVQSEQPAR